MHSVLVAAYCALEKNLIPADSCFQILPTEIWQLVFSFHSLTIKIDDKKKSEEFCRKESLSLLLPLVTHLKVTNPSSEFIGLLGEMSNLVSFEVVEYEEETNLLIDEIVKLKKLQKLSLPFCFLTSEHVDKLASSKNLINSLTSLDISDNNIGDEGFAEICKFTNLQYLNVGECQISNISEINSLTRLTNLDMHINEIGEEGAKHIKELNLLTKLNLRDNNINEAAIKHISKLDKLEELDVSYNDKLSKNIYQYFKGRSVKIDYASTDH